MAGITLNQIAIQVINEQGDHKGDDAFVSQCETWLKDSMVEIDSEGNFQVFRKDLDITTSVSVTDGLYDLPEDFRTMKYLRLVNTDKPIDYINPKTLVEYGMNLEQLGDPRHFWISDPRINASNQFIQRVRFFPIPNSTLTVDGMYYFDVINLASGSFIPLSQRAILALKSRLRMIIAKADEQWVRYNVERAEYSRNLATFLNEEKNKPARRLKAKYSDLPRKTRPSRLPYPFEG